MALLETPKADIGWKAPEFTLPGVDGNNYNLENLRGTHGLLVIFMCNHCPYVQRQIDKINEVAETLQHMGFGVCGINANDAEQYPEDSFDNMKAYASQESLCFPYLYDETQEVAKAYGAICTPDFFGFGPELTLQYRGRIDDGGDQSVASSEMLRAMQEVAERGATGAVQRPSMGCSIKWRQ